MTTVQKLIDDLLDGKYGQPDDSIFFTSVSVTQEQVEGILIVIEDKYDIPKDKVLNRCTNNDIIDYLNKNYCSESFKEVLGDRIIDTVVNFIKTDLGIDMDEEDDELL